MARAPSDRALTGADLRARWLLAEALGPPRSRAPHPLTWAPRPAGPPSGPRPAAPKEPEDG